MPKVTYLLGAGASAGQKDANGIRLRGVPTICEFAQECQLCIEWVRKQNYFDYSSFEQELEWLLNVCTNYPTVDTYARMLFTTRQNGYLRLKHALSLFLTLIQKHYPHDIRYDGWIAALVNDDGMMPDSMNVLSWNYDAQFEMAYCGYFKDADLKYLWNVTNVLNKSLVYTPKNNDKFSFIKLNGTAFTHWSDGMGTTGIFDALVHPDREMPIETVLVQSLRQANNVENELSYVWETLKHDDVFLQTIKDRVEDTEVVVIIGYSFPYVNRSMDKLIFASMPKLQKIYVQDLNPDSVIESVRGRLAEREETIKIIPQRGLNQFYIPNELD